jgi:hypothetical protein
VAGLVVVVRRGRRPVADGEGEPSADDRALVARALRSDDGRAGGEP